MQFWKNIIWVIPHLIITPIKYNVSEGKTKQIINFCIFYFTICFNGSLKNSNMSIWVKILHILKVVKWSTIRLIWWYGGLVGFTIGNPKYLEGPSGPSGHDPLPLGSDGRPTKIPSTSLGIFVCIFIRSVPLEVFGMDLIPIMVRGVGVVVNGALVTGHCHII